MPGLMTQTPQIPPQGQGAPMAPPARAGLTPQTGPQRASPQQQDLYNRFVANALRLISNPAVTPQLLQTLRSNPDPVAALAKATVMIVIRVEDDANKSGLKIDGAVLLHGGNEILGSIALLASKAKIHDYTQEEKDAAFVRAADQYRLTRQKQGRLDTGAMQQDMERLKQASAQGTLEQQFPQVAALAKKPSGGSGAQQPGARPGMMPPGPMNKKKSRRNARRRKAKMKRRGMMPDMGTSMGPDAEMSNE